MTTSITRREFVATTAATGLSLLAAGNAYARKDKPFKTKLHKAAIRGLPNEKTLATLKEAGFEGIECTSWNAKPADAEKARKIADKLDMRIHCVLRAWTQFNDRNVVDRHVATVGEALKTAEIMGADAILLVPCRIGGKAPRPWEFDIKFNKKNGHLISVAEGDNEGFKDYMRAHDHATDASREALKKLIPVAEKTGVVIGIENVWNNLWVKPKIFAHFVKSFKSKWVQAYFDIGNHVQYAPPEEWILELGKQLVKCHVKDFKLNPNGHGGRFSNIREGSVNWPAVRKALDKVRYNGWLTLEGSGNLPLPEQGKRMELIVQGK